jgi:hypothetical protein
MLPGGQSAVVPDGPHDANYTTAENLAALVVPFLDRISAQPAG